MRSLVFIKTDGMQKKILGDVISRFYQAGLELTDIKSVIPDSSLIERHYTHDPNWLLRCGSNSLKGQIKKGIKPAFDNPMVMGYKILDSLKNYLSDSLLIVMIWEGRNAVPAIRKIVGPTEPLSAPAGTIRGDYSTDAYGDKMENLIHASASPEEAESEIDIWF